MADKIIASISYIRTVSKKKATIEKILAHLSKSEICDKTWSTESLKELLSDMTAKDQIELVDSGYKIKQNEAQDDNDFDDNCNFVKNTQIDCTSSVSDIFSSQPRNSYYSRNPANPFSSLRFVNYF